MMKTAKRSQNEILDDVNEILERMQSTSDNEEKSDHAITESCSCSPEPIENDIAFGGFELLYNKALELEDQPLCPECQAQAGNDYNELKNSFELFQRKLRQVILETKRKNEGNMRQLTIHDLFKS